MQRRILTGNISFGWPERILGGVFAVLLVTLGLAFGALALGLGLATGLGLAVRAWWLRPRLRRAAVRRHCPRVIEGEYRVLERHGTAPNHDAQF